MDRARHGMKLGLQNRSLKTNKEWQCKDVLVSWMIDNKVVDKLTLDLLKMFTTIKARMVNTNSSF